LGVEGQKLQEERTAKHLQTTLYKKHLIYFSFKFKWQAIEIKEVAILIFDTECDAIHKVVHQTVTQYLLQEAL